MLDDENTPSLSPAKRALLQNWRRGRAITEGDRIERAPSGEAFEPSYRQLGMWLVEQLEPGTPVNNQSFCVDARGPLDVAALEGSLQALVRRQELLRAAFVAKNGTLRTEVRENAHLPLRVVDLRGRCEDPEREVIEQTIVELAQPFDISSAPLVRTTLFRLTEERHALLLVFHHMVFDGWSAGVVGQEIAAHYDALTHGRTPSLSELPVQFGDVARWQRQRFHAGDFEQELKFWREQLTPPPPPLPLPLDRPRPAGASVSRRAVRVRIPKELTEAVKALARRVGATPFSALLAAFKLLLARTTGERDISVGAPVANRELVETAGLVGPLFNMLTVRSSISEHEEFSALVSRVHRAVAAAYANQSVPIEIVAQELRANRPLYSVSFALQNFPFPRSIQGRVAFSPFALDSEALQFGGTNLDLALALIESGSSLSGYLEYNPEVFDRTTVARFLERYVTLLERVVAHPDGMVGSFDVISEHERAQVLALSVPAAVIQAPATLHELFEAQVARTPDAPAVLTDHRCVTYRELDARAEALCSTLEAVGVGPGSLVAVIAERSTELVAALIAVLKAGAAYVPIEPSYPHARISYILEDARVSAIVGERALVGAFGPSSARHVFLDELAEPVRGMPKRGRRRVSPDCAAYAIYTSGSTGRPKGAVVSHRAIVNHMRWMLRVFPLTSGDCIMQKTPIGFDASIWEFYAPLLAGALLFMPRPQGERDIGYMVRTIQKHAITVIQLVPTLLRLFIAERLFAASDSLRLVFVGGEPLRSEDVEAFAAQSSARLVNLYGPTEACIDATAWECDRLASAGGVRIGVPVDNVMVYVLDERLAPSPLGTTGEIHIAGRGLAESYIGQAEETACRFLPDPLATEPGTRMYRTHDLGRWREDGGLEFLGRSDNQIKLRGFRIELGEVEHALSQLEGVAAAAVVHVDEAVTGGRIVGYLVPLVGASLKASQMRLEAARLLPAHMVPSILVIIDALPVTPNGKVDSAALRARPEAKPVSHVPFAEPRSDIEARLAQIWCESLRLDRVGIDDNFFELGGQSITLMRAHKAVVDHFQIDLPVVEAFRFPTIRALAARLAGVDLSSEHEASDRGLQRRQAMARRRHGRSA